MPADPDVLCIASCTGFWRCWLAWLCARGARRTSRSSCCATNSGCSAARSTCPTSTMTTGACSARSQPRSLGHAARAGSSPQTPCCAGIAAASPDTGLNPTGRQDDRPPRPRSVETGLHGFGENPDRASNCDVAGELRLGAGETGPVEKVHNEVGPSMLPPPSEPACLISPQPEGSMTSWCQSAIRRRSRRESSGERVRAV